jgi:diguanylate cyclase (GGDEF)-like protein
MTDARLLDERARQSALNRYAVLDTAPEEPFEKIVNLVRVVLNVPIVAVSLVDAHRQWFKAICGLDAPETPRNISFCTHTIQAHEPMLIADAQLDQRFWQNPLVTGAPFIRSYLGVPLKTPDGYNVGSLCVIDTIPRHFEPKQIAILSAFARLVVDELELRQIAARDQLTGAWTRRAILDRMTAEIGRGLRHGRQASLVLADLDHFKAINDTFGHATGDEVLRFFTEQVAQLLRVSDEIGRWGGEEFAILLPETTGEAAFALMERVRTSLGGAGVPALEGKSVTASFGIAELRAGTDDAAAWLARADKAMYAAKAAGRNRVATYADDDGNAPAAR